MSSTTSTSTTSASAIPSPPSSELCALIGFAYRLGSVVHNNTNLDGDNSDVRREAKLLMSLSCSSPAHTDDERDTTTNNNNNSNINAICNNNNNDGDTTFFSSACSSSSTVSTATSTGRITPTHSITSISSGGSRRDTFSFTCPSLSLNNNRHHSHNTRGSNGDTTTNVKPGTMLSRMLKVDDKDAMRLSSEAMARNIIESFHKAMMWRIESWVDSLSRVLVVKELALTKNLADKQELTKPEEQFLQDEVYFSNEALLVKTLREIEDKLQVLEAKTAFKVLNKVSQVDETGSALKKRRTGEQEDRTGLEEGEYVYDVIHVLEMQCSLNVSTPAGNVRIDLNAPGQIRGTFFSSEDDEEEAVVDHNKLTDVTIDLNTDMMASMIEKSSRIAVRASTEALLKGDALPTSPEPKTATVVTKTVPTAAAAPKPPLPTRSPKRKVEDPSRINTGNVSGLVVITPARNTASSPSSFGESDSDGDHQQQPVRLQIPDSFPSGTAGSNSNKILQPQASRKTSTLGFCARLPPKKYLLQQKSNPAAVVTPLKTKGPEYIEREKGPNLPILLESAGLAKKK